VSDPKKGENLEPFYRFIDRDVDESECRRRRMSKQEVCDWRGDSLLPLFIKTSSW